MRKTKFFLALAALLLGVCGAWATTTIYPTSDMLCRNGSSTTWNKLGNVKTPTEAVDSIATFELKYQSKLYAIMQFEVPNFKAVKSMSFIFTMDNAATLMGVWNYSGYDMPQANGESATYTYQKATEVTGVEPGSTSDTSLIEPLAQGNNVNGVWTLAIDANAIASSVVYKADGTTAVVQLLLTTYNPATRTNASKIIAYNADDQTKMPHLNIEYVEDYSKPVQEICYRTNSGNTGWNNTSYPMMAGASNSFEMNHSGRLCAVYQFWISDLDLSKNYTFKLTKSGNETDLYAWEFPYTFPLKNSDSPTDFVANVATVTGVALGTAKDAGTYNTTYVAKAVRTDGVATFTIKGSDMKNVAKDARGNTVLTLLVTSQLGSTYKCYNSLSAVEDAKKPTFATAGYVNVFNETQQIAYDDLQSACDAAAAGDEIQVLNDIEQSTRLTIEKDITISGATAATTIKRATSLNDLWILTKADVTLKDITLDGQSTEREKNAVEIPSGSDDYKLTLNNVTFQNFAPINGYTDVYMNGKTLNLVGNNVIPNGIKVGKGKRVDDKGNATHTTAIKLYVVDTYVSGAMIVAQPTDLSMYTIETDGWALGDDDKDLYAYKIGSSITLDDTKETNNQLLSAYNDRTVDVTLTRSIAESETDYSTLCLPFEVEASEINAADVLEYSYTNVDNGTATLYFTSVTTLEAGKPYLVRLSSALPTVFTSKTITAASPVSYGDSHYNFVGLYSQTKITETQTTDKMYLGSGNQLYWAGENCTIKGLRGYFEAVSYLSKAAKRVAIVRGGTTDVTTISIIDKQDANDNQNTKMIINGQLVIKRNDVLYDARGQKIQSIQ